MLNMNYKGKHIIYPIKFQKISKNVVELKGDFPIRTDGFVLSRPEREDNWEYPDYTTIYRKIDGGVQFSNDGSVYIEPESMPEFPNISFGSYEPTPEELAL